MPCSDVTEIIQVTLDAEDRLSDYFFRKRTCGQGVGAGNLLLPVIAGWHVEDAIACDAEGILTQYPFSDDIEYDLEEFLALKHFFAVQALLEVYTGREPGGKGNLCAAAEIGYEPDGTVVITGQIDVDLVTEQIRSCGNCKGCGKKKQKVTFF